jgi:hypothetical protein
LSLTTHQLGCFSERKSALQNQGIRCAANIALQTCAAALCLSSRACLSPRPVCKQLRPLLHRSGHAQCTCERSLVSGLTSTCQRSRSTCLCMNEAEQLHTTIAMAAAHTSHTQGGKWVQLFHVLNGCSNMHPTSGLR